ncbi:HAD-IA family hydrolase, partial [Jannaschia aquimarina]
APPRPRDIRSVIGLSLPQMVDVLASDAPRTLREKIVAGYRLRYFDAVENEDPPVFDGAEPAILRLKAAGVQMGLTTGKSQRSLDFVLERMRWRDWFATIQTADDNPSKPDPTMIVRALAETGREASDTILVGDTRYDMRMARAAGVPAIGVGWGYNAPDELRAEGASAIATDFGHLVSILSAWRQTHDDAADMAVRDV